jgi:hypothetical protein
MTKRAVPFAEVERRTTFVEHCLLVGMTHRMVYLAARQPPPEGLGIGQTSTEKYIRRVRERWLMEAEASRPNDKANAVNRLMQSMRDARRAGKWSAVLGFERLIADIQGTREPLRVDLNMNVNTALMNIIGSYTDEQRDSILAEYEEMEERAKLAEAQDPLQLNGSSLNGSGPH